MSAKRIIIEKAIVDALTEKFVAKAFGLKVGNPKEPDTVLSSIKCS